MSEAEDRALRERRIALVREHMQSENELRFDVTLETFDHPRYELIARPSQTSATRMWC
jgi:hypothetical protein